MKASPLLLSVLFALPSHAASLRTSATLSGAQVYLRDLFDDAGVNADRLLGTGPTPGGRIVVEARQLRAIANQFGVDWRPVSNADRAILEWPGRPLRKDEVIAAVRDALMSQGAAPDCDIEIPGLVPPLVPLSGASPAAVTQIDYQPAQGRFAATLSVTAPGMEPVTLRVAGQVADVIEVPITVVRLPAGAIPGPRDIRMARIHVNTINGDVARSTGSIVGMQLKRQIPSGQPIALADLTRPTEVTRGDPVRVGLEANGLSLAGEGIALESGAAGERIRVRNQSSQAVIEALVVGPGQVRVVPGTVPITAQARSGLSAARGG
jgi:flagellar basal body P-ring formation protein FlgA